MPGLIGFYTFGEGRENWDASHFIHYGLSALQGRGQESVSIATIGSGNTLHTLGGRGSIKKLFQTNIILRRRLSRSRQNPLRASSRTRRKNRPPRRSRRSHQTLRPTTLPTPPQREGSSQSDLDAHQQDRRRILLRRPHSQPRTRHREKPARCKATRHW